MCAVTADGGSAGPAARPSAPGRPLSRKVVALGGGHGLFASLSALRRVTRQLTAVVTVADDGGSSGRLRREFGVLPPGDLRMALAALCGDDDWGTTWSQVVQHRFTGDADLGGHAVGNVLIVALWELLGDTVQGLDWVGRLLGAHGRVLPMASVPLDLAAEVEGADPDRPDVDQHRSRPGRLREDHRAGTVDLVDSRGPARLRRSGNRGRRSGLGSARARFLVHQRAPAPAGPAAGRGRCIATRARRVVALNLAPQPGETEGFSPHTHLEVLADHAPQLTIDVVLADRQAAAGTTAELEKAAGLLGGRLVLADLAMGDGSARHDPRRLAGAFAQIFEGE